MFFNLLIAFSLCSKRRICICNSKCSSLCPSETFIGTSFNSSFYSTLKTREQEIIEFDFYSGEELFLFEIDLHFFKINQIKLKFKTLKDSNPVIITSKNNDNESKKRSIIINPNEEIFIQDEFDFYTNNNKQSKKMNKNKSLKSYQKSPIYQKRTTVKAEGNYSNTNVFQNRIPTTSFNYSSLGDQNNYPIRNAFDNNIRTFWSSSIVTTATVKDQITINFFNLTCIESIVYSISFSTNKSALPKYRYYGGFPLELNIYTSSYDDPFELSFTFSGTPDPYELWENALFKFHQPIWCDKLILEFVNVTYERFFGNDYTASCSEISFMPPNVLIPTKSSIPSIYPIMPTKTEDEEKDDSIHFTSTMTSSKESEKKEVNSKSKKKSAINKSTIVVIVIGVEMVAIIGIIIALLVLLIRRRNSRFRNFENSL